MATIDELNVKISADVTNLKRGVVQANKRLKGLGKQSKKSTKELNKGLQGLGNRFSNLASSIAIVQGPLGGVAGRFSAIGALIKRVNVATILAIGSFTALSVVVGKSISTFIPFEKSVLRLGSVLKATGRESETSIKRLDRFAIQLGKATLTSRIAVLDAVGALAAFENIKTSQFEQILTIAQDLSAVFKGDLKSNTILLARALSAPGEAFTILERQVGKFTVAERELLLELQNTGRLAEAQAIIFKKLDTVMGAATREADGTAGALDTLGESVTNLSISFVETSEIAKLFTAGIRVLSGTLDLLNKKLTDPTNRLRILRDTVTRLENDIKTLSKLPEFISGKAIDRSQRKLKEAREELAKFRKSLEDPLPEVETDSMFKLTESARKASIEISQGLAKALLDSRTNLRSFADFAESIFDRIAQRIIEINITQPLLEGIFKQFKIPSVPGLGETKGKAGGGQVQANRPVVVGERGPELLVPNVSGTIVPNNKMGGGGVTVIQNFTITAGADVMLVDQKIMAATPEIARQAQGGVMEAIQDGGMASRLVGRKF